MFMKQGFWGMFLLVFLMACQDTTKNTASTPPTTIKTTNTSSSQTTTTSSQNDGSSLKYTIHTKNKGPKAELGKFLTMNLSYKNANDSIIFNSFQRQRPVTYKFSKTLFRGALNEGIFNMAAGDSATFHVSADKLYGEHIPSFAKSGENLVYTMKLISISDEPNLKYRNRITKERKDGGK